MAMMRYIAGVTLVLPYLAVAQDADLRATIEASLRSDPRAAALSKSEFESLVQALMQEAETQGQVSELLATENSFGNDLGFTPPIAENVIITPTLILAVLLFLGALFFVVRRIARRTSNRVPLQST